MNYKDIPSAQKFNEYYTPDHSKFEEEDRDLLEHQIQASIKGNQKEIDSISTLREKNYKRKPGNETNLRKSS